MYFNGFRFEIVTFDLFGGYVNSYIMETKNNIFVIDSNIERTRKSQDDIFSLLPVKEKPMTVLLTHGHWDHAGLCGYLKDKYGAKILANKDSEKMMSDKPYQLTALYDRFAPQFPFADGIRDIYNEEFTHPAKPDGYLKDGDVFTDEGFTLKVMAMPGHCKDELSFYNPENRLLFCGDTVQGRGYDGNPALYDDAAALRKSLKMIRELNPMSLYGGHFSVCGPDTCRQFVDASFAFADEIDEFLKDNPGDIEAQAKAFCSKYGYNFAMHVICTLTAHKR